MNVYVVILNYMQWQDTAACVTSVLASGYKNFRIIVVDNCSGNHSLQHLQANLRKSYEAIPSLILSGTDFGQMKDFKTLPRVSFVQHSVNAGFAGGNNLVLRQLACENEYVWLLNPDMIVETGTMAALVKFASIQPARSVIGTVIRSYKEPRKLLLYGGARINFNSATIEPVTNPMEAAKIDFICGGSFFFHSGHLRELGLLPEDYFLYWEETDWCYRAREKGYLLLVCPEAVCYDKGSTTIGKGFLADFYYTRNGLRFTARFKKKLMPRVIFSAGLRFLKRLLTGQWKRAGGVYKGVIHYSNHEQKSHE
ncbi:MAG: glycosyltransferase family 2 protein [Flavisolibacter sp.]